MTERKRTFKTADELLDHLEMHLTAMRNTFQGVMPKFGAEFAGLVDDIQTFRDNALNAKEGESHD